MSDLHFEADINASPETVFNLLSDLPNYGRWLSDSDLYNDTLDISDNPIKLGTTYLDHGKQLDLFGKVTEFVPNSRLAFYEATKRGDVEVTIRYTLTPRNGGTHLERDTTGKMRGILGLFQPLVMRRIRKEGARIVARIKSHLES
jgi:uncharacterized protein YndB with AHSA1/START domain